MPIQNNDILQFYTKFLRNFMFCNFLSMYSRFENPHASGRITLTSHNRCSSITRMLVINNSLCSFALRRVLALDERDNFSSMCKIVRVLPNVPQAFVFAVVLRTRSRRPPHETGLNMLFNLRHRIFRMDPRDPSCSSATSWLR